MLTRLALASGAVALLLFLAERRWPLRALRFHFAEVGLSAAFRVAQIVVFGVSAGVFWVYEAGTASTARCGSTSRSAC